MANTTSVPAKTVRELAAKHGITEGFGSRGRVSASTYAAVFAAEPKVLATVASDLGIKVTGLRGSKRAEKIAEIAASLV